MDGPVGNSRRRLRRGSSSDPIGQQLLEQSPSLVVKSDKAACELPPDGVAAYDGDPGCDRIRVVLAVADDGDIEQLAQSDPTVMTNLRVRQ